jgi:uncharacterized protein (DUF362 family)
MRMNGTDTRRTRRELLASVGKVAIFSAAARCLPLRAAPTAPVAVARCRTYDPKVLVPTLDRMFDRIGGLGRIVKGKTIAIKVNLTGLADMRLRHAPIEATTWTHPSVIAATIHLMDRAGAHRIRILESPWSTDEPLEEFIVQAGWDLSELTGAARRVEFENTNYVGFAKKYHRFEVPGGGHMFPGYDLNHSYADCDVFASIAKMKEHRTAGITLAMKNCFGITPCTIYGDGSGLQGPSPFPVGGRAEVIHWGTRGPSASAPQEKDPNSPRNGGYRVPRVIADLVAARPIHFCVVDGITSQAVGETATSKGSFPVSPGVLVAGTNPVCTDAVGAALMGFDPTTDRGTPPFENCDSTLLLAEKHGVGSADLARIEVAGSPLAELAFDFRAARREQNVTVPDANLERPADFKGFFR